MDFTSSIVTGYSVLTVGTQIAALLLIASFLLKPLSPILAWMEKNAITIMFAGALLATVGSLYFSEIAGWTPCVKCWYQRIFMYPQVIILLVALIRKDRTIAYSVLWLSLIGLVIAADHYAEQVNLVLNPANPAMPCDETGVSCARTPFFHFGYITIPMMAASVFLLNILLSWSVLRQGKKSHWWSRIAGIVK